jgi:hypothetical protein
LLGASKVCCFAGVIAASPLNDFTEAFPTPEGRRKFPILYSWVSHLIRKGLHVSAASEFGCRHERCL